jgi:hypothetical protein
VFDSWAGNIVASKTKSSTTITIPQGDVIVTATYRLSTIKALTLTVKNGNGSGTYVSNALVTVTANPPPAGYIFDKWTGVTTGISTNYSTVLFMKGTNAFVTAEYKVIPTTAFPLTVKNGTGTGSYKAASTISIKANTPPAGYIFDCWKGSAVANPTSPSTTLSMPAIAAVVEASYRKPLLSVTSGSGDGSYASGTTVTIVASVPPIGQVFDKWTGASVANATSPTTTLTMPSSNLRVSANYRSAVLGYNIQNALPTGYVKDGSVDYTTYIQNAISANNVIIFPGFPVLINENCLTIGSNKTITFLPGSEIRLKPSTQNSYNILNMRSVSNITLYGPVIRGDRFTRTVPTTEFGLGIGIRGCSNINIYNAQVHTCMGDGIYVSGAGSSSSSGNLSRNINLVNSICKSNGRDGISVISVDGLNIDSAYCGYTDGTSPFCGINFEPDSFDEEIKNCNLSDIVTEFNGGNGIQFTLGNLYGGPNKNIGINIKNYTDFMSRKAFKLGLYTTDRVGSETVKGTVLLENAYFRCDSDRTGPLNTALWGKEDIFFSIVNPKEQALTGKIYGDQELAFKWSQKAINSDAWYSITFKY